MTHHLCNSPGLCGDADALLLRGVYCGEWDVAVIQFYGFPSDMIVVLDELRELFGRDMRYVPMNDEEIKQASGLKNYDAAPEARAARMATAEKRSGPRTNDVWDD